MDDTTPASTPAPPAGAAETSAKARYERLSGERWAVRQRAIDASKLTIPTLVPMIGVTQQTKLPTPWQSMGARCVNNLAAKLLLALFPPNANFFRFEIADDVVAKLGIARTAIESALSAYERQVQGEFEVQAIRVPAYEAMKHLIVAGNVLCYMQPKGGMRNFIISQYVVKRDPSGNVMEIITEEFVDPRTLPQEIQKYATRNVDKNGGEKNVAIYTWVRRVKNIWRVHQEIEDKIVEESRGSYPLDKSPWMPLRWNRIDGEDYGRGLVEEYQGDLQSLDGLSQAIVEGSAAAAKVVFLVKPNGTTKIKTIVEAPNGAVRAGNSEEVSVLQMQKYNDFRVAKETISELKEHLSSAFLLNSSVQRDAERVTAEEIRFMAQELESTQGGLYSILSLEFQKPMATRLVYQMERAGKLPQLPQGAVKLTVITGLAALGRGNDLQKLDDFVQGAAEALTPQVVAQYINPGDYLSRRATSLGIDPTGLVKSDQEVQQQQQQAAAQEAAQAAVPHAVKGGADILKENVKAANAQQSAPAQGAGAAPG